MLPLLAQAMPPPGLNGWQILGAILGTVVCGLFFRALQAQDRKHEEHDRRHDADVIALQKARDELGERLADAESRLAVTEVEIRHLTARPTRAER
jgi:hypothetical protein